MKLTPILGALALSLGGCTEPPQDCGQLPHHQAQANAGCLVVESGNLLMIQQNRGGKWSIPGGTKLPGERAACTASRETLEETGVKVSVQRQLKIMDNGFHLFLCSAEPNWTLEPQDQGEVKQVAWLNKAQRQSVIWRFPQQKQSLQSLIEEYSN